MSEELIPDPSTPDSEEPVLSDQQVRLALEVLRAEQSLVNGTVAGLVASVAGAGIWAGVTILTEYQIGWIAIGIGFIVGYAVRVAGKGLDRTFGIVGGVLSLIGCALGNVATITYYVALNEGIPFADILTQLDLAIAFDMLTSTFEIMDVLFYAIAVYFGYKYAFREVSEADLIRALGRSL